jgi:hypothetical protein
LEAILGLVSMLNATQAKMCTYLETLDKKINMVLEADKRLRALAFPQPKLSAAFIDLLPISTMEDLSEVERLLHPDSNDFMRNKEDLVIMHKYKLKLPFTFLVKKYNIYYFYRNRFCSLKLEINI